jgi:hypothetical protein
LTDVTASGGLFPGIPQSYFVTDGGILENSEDYATNYGTIFYERIRFVARPNYTGHALSQNGRFAMLGCSVSGCSGGA